MQEPLEIRQQEMQERQKVARSKQNAKNAKAGLKKKRARLPSVEKILLQIANDAGQSGKCRIEAIDRYCLLTGKPVLPTAMREKEPDDESKPATEVFRGTDLKPATTEPLPRASLSVGA